MNEYTSYGKDIFRILLRNVVRQALDVHVDSELLDSYRLYRSERRMTLLIDLSYIRREHERMVKGIT